MRETRHFVFFWEIFYARGQNSRMRTIELQGGVVRLIDQRKLPQELVVAELRDYRQVARAIKEMWIRGAPALGGAGGFGMALAALESPATTRDELVRDLERAGRELFET